MSNRQKSTLRTLNFRHICSGGVPALTKSAGGKLAEAASVLLEHRAHKSPVKITVQEESTETFLLSFLTVTEQMRFTYGDLQDATEEGACGIAIAVIQVLTAFTVIHRSWKTTGFDYFLGEAGDFLFQHK